MGAPRDISLLVESRTNGPAVPATSSNGDPKLLIRFQSERGGGGAKESARGFRLKG
jgi:hypothetical protein